MSVINYIFLGLLYLVGIQADLVLSISIGDTSHGSLSKDINGSTWLTVAVLSVAVCIVCVIAILKCTDCYNAEVATESHAACGSSKTDSAVHYGWTSNNPSGATNQPIGYQAPSYSMPNPGGHLPYSLNPEPSAPPLPPTGPGGLGGQPWGAPPSAAGGQPYSGPEQPPSYNEAMIAGSRR